MSSTRLLVLAPSHGFGGGIERVVTAVAGAWDGPLARLDLYRAGRDAAPYGDPPAKVRFVRAALVAARRREWDWILCLHAGLLPAAISAGRLSGTPVALMAYGTEVWAPMSPLRRRLVRMCGRRLAISRFTAEWLGRRAGVALADVDVIRLPIAPGLIAAACHDAPPLQRARRPLVVTVSRLAPEHRYKGHFSILEAWPIVLAREPAARWLVVGDGPDRATLMERCRVLGVQDSVELAGYVSDDQLARIYASAAILVLPSVADVNARPPEGDGFGLVYAEAGAFGVPSIASAAGGGALDFVREGMTGLTVVPGDASGLAAAICDLLARPGLRAELGDGARRRAIKRHLPEHFAQELRTALA